MTPRERWQVGLGFLALSGLGLFVALRLPGRVTTEVTAFLGGDEGGSWRLSRLLQGSELTRGMILCFGAPDPAQARAAAGEVAAVLSARPDVAWVRAGPPEGAQEAFHALYWPRRLALLSDRPEDELPARLSDEGLAEAAARLKSGIAGPMGTMLKQAAPGDPLLSYVDRIRRVEAGQSGGLQPVDGRLVADDGWAVVFLASRAGPFETEAQAGLVAAIDAAFADAARDRPGLQMERSGVAFVALASQRSVQSDVTRISTLSGLGVVLLLLVLYRSPRLIVLGTLPLAAGLITACAAGLVVFGSLHQLTLAFGATLLGVVSDYPVHLFNRHALDPSPGPKLFQAVWPGLRLAALTTAVGFGGLWWTTFPGVREIALFGTVGVFAALLCTRWLVVPLLPAPARSGARDSLARGLTRGLRWLRGRRDVAWVLLLVSLALIGAGLPRITWTDAASSMYTIDPTLDAQQKRVWSRVRRPDGAHFVVAEAKDLEQALRLTEAAGQRLASLAAQGSALGSFRAITDLLPSTELQRRNLAALRTSPELAARLDRTLQQAGFRPASFAPWRETLAAPDPPPLELRDLRASPLEGLVRPFVLHEGPESVALVTYVRGATDGDAIEAALSGLEGVLYFDQDRFLARAYGRHRREVLEMVAIGLALVLGMILLQYRSPRIALAAFLPALLAGAGALALRGLVGMPCQLLDSVALLLVFSMGVDYGVFLAEGRTEPEALPATLVSIVVACATTVLAFGLLALSQEPSLRAIGLTVGLGMAWALLLAPVALLVSAGKDEA